MFRQPRRPSPRPSAKCPTDHPASGRDGWGAIVILALGAVLGAMGPGFAQSFDGGTGILPDVALRGQGWSQLGNLAEVLDFLLAVVEVTALTRLVSLNPSIRNDRRTKADFDRPRILFLYGVIGMTVGFPVLHHGYIIGFVIFGMGGLMRFRADASTTADTTRLILMTLLGLCIGLDLPVVAFVATLAGWLVVLGLGQNERLQLEVEFDKTLNIRESANALAEVLAARGFRTLASTKTRFKPVVLFVVEARGGNRRPALMREMADIQRTNAAPVEDWHVE